MQRQIHIYIMQRRKLFIVLYYHGSQPLELPLTSQDSGGNGQTAQVLLKII